MNITHQNIMLIQIYKDNPNNLIYGYIFAYCFYFILMKLIKYDKYLFTSYLIILNINDQI